MNGFDQLLGGFLTVLTPENLLLALLGCVLGMLVGVLPGFGPAAATSLLLPITFTLGPTAAIIVLAAILYGSAYGGTITAVLLNVPGETSSVATTLDGYKMARQGRGGQALAIAAIGSFVGGVVGLLGFVLAVPLSNLALAFQPPEFFALTIFGVALVAGLGGKSIVKALISGGLGLIVGLIGIDFITGAPRFTFGQVELLDGLNLVPIVMGLFGISELFTSIERHATTPAPITVTSIWPTRDDFRRSVLPIARGSVIGFFMGLLPGSPGAATSFTSYVVERRLSKHPEEFGKGAIEGVAGPETANNSLSISGMIPLFTLGIPTSATMAIMMGAFTVNGLIPGPLLFTQHPDVAWAIIASMFVGNVILLVLNLPLARVWVAFLRIPYPLLYGFVLAIMLVGAYTIEGSAFNVAVMLVAGLIGYGLRKVDIPLAPIALTIVLAPLMEQSLRTALTISRGDPGIFFHSPLSTILLVGSVTAIAAFAIRGVLRSRCASAPSAVDVLEARAERKLPWHEE
ncbi:MAG: tripartite tricarboxylate transporter permease [Protaetiibacter sp.]